MDRQDLRSVLRFFAEVASSMKQEESTVTSDHPVAEQGGESCLPDQGKVLWESSAA